MLTSVSYTHLDVYKRQDFNTLFDLGAKSICCETDVSDLIWGEKKQIAYRATPMFLMVAEKR